MKGSRIRFHRVQDAFAPDLDPRRAQPVGYQELREMRFAVN
jgi:hypothetical protein